MLLLIGSICLVCVCAWKKIKWDFSSGGPGVQGVCVGVCFLFSCVFFWYFLDTGVFRDILHVTGLCVEDYQYTSIYTHLLCVASTSLCTPHYVKVLDDWYVKCVVLGASYLGFLFSIVHTHTPSCPSATASFGRRCETSYVCEPSCGWMP